MNNLSIIKNCQICQGPIQKVLDLGFHPLCDDLIKIKSRKIVKEYPIVILYCRKCNTAFQKYQVRKKILFPKSYHYRARLTEDVINGQKDLVKDIKNTYGSLKNKKILDIGCNDGTLLNLFKKEKAITIGIEPTDACKEVSKNHKVYFSYLKKKLCKHIINKYKKIDIITFTNVFAHINDLNEVLDCLKMLASKKTIVVIENHYLGSILNKNQFDTFYHEHPRTYSLTSFFMISRKINMSVEKYSFPKRYGGNIRVILSKNTKKKNKFNENIQEKKFYKKILQLKMLIKNWKINKKREILKMNQMHGPLPAKAFPGRAAILLKLLNFNNKNISAIYEKNISKKIGYFAPSTKIPILSDVKLLKIEKKIPIINLAWHIDHEIKKYLRKIKIKNKVITIVNKQDFKNKI